MSGFKRNFRDYTEIENNIVSSASDFTKDCIGCKLSRLLLVHLKSLDEMMNYTVAEHSHHIDDYRKPLHLLTILSRNTLREIYLLLKFGQYRGGYRSSRYLYEALFIMKGLNRDPDHTRKIWRTFKVQMNSLVVGPELAANFPFEYVEEFGKLKNSEKDKLEHDYPELRELYQYLSEGANHPLRIEGLQLEGDHHSILEEDVAETALWFLVGTPFVFG
jgi:hypothetical protein